jgi:hypothetical protein
MIQIDDDQRQRILDQLIDLGRQSPVRHRYWWWCETGRQHECLGYRPQLYADLIFAFIHDDIVADTNIDDIYDLVTDDDPAFDDDTAELTDTDIIEMIAAELLGGSLYPLGWCYWNVTKECLAEILDMRSQGSTMEDWAVAQVLNEERGFVGLTP